MISGLDDMIQDAIVKTETVVCYGDGKQRVRHPFELPEGGEE